MKTGVFFQVAAHCKGFSAYVTNIGFVPRVNLDVRIKMAFGGKFLAAEIARVRFDPKVGVYVMEKVSFHVKLSLAVITLKYSSPMKLILFWHQHIFSQ